MLPLVGIVKDSSLTPPSDAYATKLMFRPMNILSYIAFYTPPPQDHVTSLLIALFTSLTTIPLPSASTIVEWPIWRGSTE